MLKINEIFFSIQGESTLAGLPTVFIRTSGCHLRCNYCDTKYAYFEHEKMTIEEILGRVETYGARQICVTGGEPLLQDQVHNLMCQLCDRGYRVSLETSGDLSCAKVDPRVKKIIDVKTPDSGAANRFNSENLKFVGVNSEFKFVICSEKDFDWAENFVRANKIHESSPVLYSPSFEQISAQWLAEKILQSKSPARLQLQLHKYIWSPERTGV